MNANDKAAQTAERADAAERGPGMAKALLAVFVMLLSTLVLAGLIYLVMITIVPTDRREPRKAADIEQPLLHAQSAGRIQN